MIHISSAKNIRRVSSLHFRVVKSTLSKLKHSASPSHLTIGKEVRSGHLGLTG